MAVAVGLTTLCRDCFWTGEAKVARCLACASPRILSHPELARLTIAHIDCDAFYASVEKRDRPELRDIPVIVGGGVRGVVTTACYIARTFGVRSAMPMFKALKACPQAVVVKPDFSKYRHESRRIIAMFRDLTPLVQPLSLDEAWLDLGGTERLNGGAPAEILARVQTRIEVETGLTVSVGLAANKFLAKIASDLDKPKGFSVLGAEAATFLANKPVGILPGVGPAAVQALEKAGYVTVGDLARADPTTLQARLGNGGPRLHHLANGRDVREVDPDQERKSISAETTFNTDLVAIGDLEDELWPLCEKAAGRSRQAGVAGRVVTLKLRSADFRNITRRRTLDAPCQTARVLFNVAREMLVREATKREAGGRAAWRLIGVGLSDLVEAQDAPSSLFADDETHARKAEVALDALRSRFGSEAVVSGRAFRTKQGLAKDGDVS